MGLSPLFLNRVLWAHSTPISYVTVSGCSALRQAWEVVIQTIWPEKYKIFTIWPLLESVFRLLYPYWFLVSACSINYRERPDRSSCRHWVCIFIPALPSGFALYVWSYVVSDTVFKLSYLPLVEVLSLWSDLSLPRFSAFVWNSSPDSATFGYCVSCAPLSVLLFLTSLYLYVLRCVL